LYVIIFEKQKKQKKQVESIFAPLHRRHTCRGIVFFDSKAIFENIQKQRIMRAMFYLNNNIISLLFRFYPIFFIIRSCRIRE